MKNKKSLLCVLITIAIIFYSISVAFVAKAEDYIARYTGSTQSNGMNISCTFQINEIADNRFRGVFSDSGTGIYDFSENIEGNYYRSGDKITCIFHVSFYNNRYYSDVCITIKPYEGTANCFCVGSWHFENFEMYGTQFIPSIDTAVDNGLYSEEEMKMCSLLSLITYHEDELVVNNETINVLDKFDNVDFFEEKVFIRYSFNVNSLEIHDYFDGGEINTNPDDAPLYIITKDNGDSCKMYVAIRGTYKDEWVGNTEITGTSYDSEKTAHDNFEKAKNNIKQIIFDYYTDLSTKYEYIDLVVTGHSRGAAVANLYAKEATDVIRGVSGIENVPTFNSVVAYTFACPNVAKYSSTMETYNNIFNFCFKEDLVTTVPLTSPTLGWNYWKYGVTLLGTLDFEDFEKLTIKNGLKNDNAVREIHGMLSPWRSVHDYYNLPIVSFAGELQTLYEFAHYATGILSGEKSHRISSWSKSFYHLKDDALLVPFFVVAAKNASSISFAHDYNTYTDVLYNLGSSNFTIYTYSDYLSLNSGSVLYLENPIIKNQDEINALKTIISSSNLDWDVNDTDTWKGISWDLFGHINSIDMSCAGLSGHYSFSAFENLTSLNLSFNDITSIDLSNNLDLVNLDLSSNSLTNIDISNCINLESYNCSFNDLSTMANIVSVSNTQLTELICDKCNLSSINISILEYLEYFSCAFNNLTTLDISNSSLNSVDCSYNYLDINCNGNLYSTIMDLRFAGKYVNYKPQLIPDNATFNSNELTALRQFAMFDNNNTYLNWLDENNELIVENLQNNVMFEYDGSNYRVVDLELQDLPVQGILNLSTFANLEELYCENTNITSVNLRNCTKINTIVCDNSEITEIVFPTNANKHTSNIYILSCENNHIDISTFDNDMINAINFKSGSTLNYRHQLINADVLDFYEDDYNALIDFANQNNNINELDWDLDNPGYWDNVNWKYDTTTNKYRLLDCYFDYLGVSGNADFSVCDKLEDYSFSGTEISTALIPSNIPNGAFYDCERLEAVILSDDTTCIGDSAFKYCTSLQVVYMPDSVTTIGNDVFKYSPNVKIAGVSDSFAENYATTSNIPFEAGYFVCANVVTKEAADGNNEHFYPVEGVNLLDENNEAISISDKYGYFVLFGLNEDDYTNILSYKYGYDLEMISHISNSSIIVLTPIQMVSYDFVKDGYINAKDYKSFVDMKKNDDTDENYKYYDIDKNGIVDENDWCFAQEFFLQSNSIKDTVEAGYDLTNYLIAPLSLNDDPDNSSGPIEVGGIEDIYVDFD